MALMTNGLWYPTALNQRQSTRLLIGVDDADRRRISLASCYTDCCGIPLGQQRGHQDGRPRRPGLAPFVRPKILPNVQEVPLDLRLLYIRPEHIRRDDADPTVMV
jgi:hypothetical protein